MLRPGAPRSSTRRVARPRILLQVHDELVLELPASELEETTALVRRCMEEAVVLDVPLQVDVGSGANWLEAH